MTVLAVEAGRGDGLLSQLGSGTGQAWFAYTVAVLSVASLVPLLQGESAEGTAGAVMNANAELWNGRLAMLGLVALAATEIITGAPFINAAAPLAGSVLRSPSRMESAGWSAVLAALDGGRRQVALGTAPRRRYDLRTGA